MIFYPPNIASHGEFLLEGFIFKNLLAVIRGGAGYIDIIFK